MVRPKSTSSFKPEFPGQHADEQIDLVFRHHPVILRKPLIACLALIAISEIPLILLPPEQLGLGFKIFGVGILIALIVGFYYWLGWFYSVYILTDNRLIDIQQKGLFNRRVNELGLDKVQSINYETKGIQAAIFKFGDINIQTFGGVEWLLKSISHPADVHSHLMNAARRVTSSVSYSNSKKS